MLYTGPNILKNINNNAYKNCISLHVAVRILCSDKYCKDLSYIQYSHNSPCHFVKSFMEIYGAHHISHNIHALLHLAKDIELYGTLDNFSTFKFENYMQNFKKMLRKDDKPLQQVVRRVEENKTNCQYFKCECDLKTHEQNDYFEYNNKHNKGPLITGTSNPQFLEMKFKSFKFIPKDRKNYCCTLNNGDVVIIENIAFNQKENGMAIIGRKFLYKNDFYKEPLPSSILGIYEVQHLSELLLWPTIHIVCKNVMFKAPGNQCYTVFPLLHSDREDM